MLSINSHIPILYMLIELLVIAVIVLIVWLVARRRAVRYYSNMNKTIDNEKVKYREMKRQMTNNIAHELRTPVSSIRGYLETLSTCRDIDEEHRQMFIDRAYAQTIRLSDLIRDIALLTEIEAGRGSLGTEAVSVREAFSDVLDEFKDRITDAGDYIENLLPHSLEIRANRTLLTAIFSNLVENSLKYAGGHVTIHIECAVRNNGVYAFKYYDTGVGVAAEHRKRIFERFYRVSEGRTRDAGGSGLGLSIVRNSVAFHGGEIEAIAHHGGGLEYRFTLKGDNS